MYLSDIMRAQSGNPCLKISAVCKLHLGFLLWSWGCFFLCFVFKAFCLKTSCRYLDFEGSRKYLAVRGCLTCPQIQLSEGKLFSFTLNSCDARFVGFFSPTLSNSPILSRHQLSVLQFSSDTNWN